MSTMFPKAHASRSATKLFGPTSCSAKGSDLDLFLPKVRYVRKKVRACVGKERGAFGKNAGPLESAFACVYW